MNGSNQRLLNTGLFPNPSVALGSQLTSDNIFFDGTSAVIASGGSSPKLYTPAVWNSGSSYSHWDETTYLPGNVNSLMTYALGTAEANHHPGFITRGLLKDLGWTIDQPLPVELSSFSVSLIGSKVKLTWQTETEVNNYGFEVERQASPNPSKGGELNPFEWVKIGFVNGSGNSNSPKNYSFSDESAVTGKYAYRLRQIDNDGTFEFSKAIEVDLGLPSNYELTQNYPNPFNPTTTIRFILPKAGFVKLIIYDMLGQELKILVNETKEPGVHTINFNAEELNSGVYIYKLEANDFSQIKKMLLIK